MHSLPMGLALALYGLASAFHLLSLSRVWEAASRLARPILAVAVLAHLLAIGHQHLGHFPPPITAVSSILNLALFAGMVVFVVADLFRERRLLGAMMAPLATLVLATLFHHAAGQPPARLAFMRFVTPVHIATSALGFACFGVAAAASVMAIVADFRLRNRRGHGWPPLPPLARLETWAAAALRIGYPFYTVGILLGGVWAWFSGEQGALLLPEYLLGVAVWLLFGVSMLLSATWGFRGRRFAVLTTLGFAATLPIVLMYALRRLG
ncbi:cytochrome c biogenesis protein CcsA [Myxococcota bacterium]|nr:cytochrome c biogenesis protein CcsA [Myxococcota bacterium]